MKPELKPLAAYRWISLASSIFLLCAFVLLLLIGLSLPLVRGVYILRVYATTRNALPRTSIATELRFGVWGFCAISALDSVSWLSNNGTCFGPKLGYDIPDFIIALLGLSDSILQAINLSLFVVLVLHLVAACVAFVALLASLFLGSHAMSIISLVLTIISALLSTVMFIVDLFINIQARNRLPELTNGGFAVGYGNSVWMALSAMIINWLAVVLLSARACYCLGVRKHGVYSGTEKHDNEYRPSMSERRA